MCALALPAILNLEATGREGSVDVSWLPPNQHLPGAAVEILYREANGLELKRCAQFDQDSFVIPDLRNGVTFHVRVRLLSKDPTKHGPYANASPTTTHRGE